MIDRELVTRKMVLIAQDLPAVEALAGRTREDYLANPTDEVLAERYLERMIGRMIDVNFHLLTESGEPPPRDYHQSFVDSAASAHSIPTSHAGSPAPPGSATAWSTSTTSSTPSRSTRRCVPPSPT